MGLYILDTSTLTLLERRHPKVSAAVVAHTGETVGVTSVNVEEALGGWYAQVRRAKTAAEEATASALLAKSVTLLAQFPIFPLTEPAIHRFKSLRRRKINIGGNDLRIAAIALELGAVVVTNNVRDFARVPTLVWEDWSV